MRIRGKDDDYIIAYIPNMYVQTMSGNSDLLRVTNVQCAHIAYKGVKITAGNIASYLICRVAIPKLHFEIKQELSGVLKKEYQNNKYTILSLLERLQNSEVYTTIFTNCVSMLLSAKLARTSVLDTHELALLTNGTMGVLSESPVLPVSDSASWCRVFPDLLTGTAYSSLAESIACRCNVSVDLVNGMFESLHEAVAAKIALAEEIGLEKYEILVPYLCSVNVSNSVLGRPRISVKSKIGYAYGQAEKSSSTCAEEIT